MLLRELLNALGQAELLERRHGDRDDAERERDRTALAEHVDAEARQALGGVGDVEIAGLLKLVVALRCLGGDRAQDPLEIVVGQRWPVQRGDLAVVADHRRPADLQVDVGSPRGNSAREERFEFHAVCLGTGRHAL